MKATNPKKQGTKAENLTLQKKPEEVRKTLTCRYCKTDTLVKAKPRNFLDTHVFPLIRISPYRCSSCKRRDYYFERT